MARKKPVKHYSHTYNSQSQAVSRDGSTIRMENGHVYKRTVLPSVADAKAIRDADFEKLSDEIEEPDSLND